MNQLAQLVSILPEAYAPCVMPLVSLVMELALTHARHVVPQAFCIHLLAPAILVPVHRVIMVIQLPNCVVPVIMVAHSAQLLQQPALRVLQATISHLQLRV